MPVVPSADATPALKILLASDCYVPRLGGIEVQVHELGRQLTRAGHHVEVVTPFPGPDVVDGIQVHRLGEPLLPLDVPFTRRTFRKTDAILAAGGYDVAHFHGGVVSPFAFGGAYLSQRQGIPTVMTSHCVWNRTQLVFRVLDRAVSWKDVAGGVLRRQRPGRVRDPWGRRQGAPGAGAPERHHQRDVAGRADRARPARSSPSCR